MCCSTIPDRSSRSGIPASVLFSLFLHAQGIENIDTLIISHQDNDHIGGADSLLQHIPIKEIYSSVPMTHPLVVKQQKNT